MQLMENIIKLRKEKNISQRTMAELLNTTQNQLRNTSTTTSVALRTMHNASTLSKQRSVQSATSTDAEQVSPVLSFTFDYYFDLDRLKGFQPFSYNFNLMNRYPL